MYFSTSNSSSFSHSSLYSMTSKISPWESLISDQSSSNMLLISEGTVSDQNERTIPLPSGSAITTFCFCFTHTFFQIDFPLTSPTIISAVRDDTFTPASLLRTSEQPTETSENGTIIGVKCLNLYTIHEFGALCRNSGHLYDCHRSFNISSISSVLMIGSIQRTPSGVIWPNTISSAGIQKS